MSFAPKRFAEGWRPLNERGTLREFGGSPIAAFVKLKNAERIALYHELYDTDGRPKAIFRGVRSIPEN